MSASSSSRAVLGTAKDRRALNDPARTRGERAVRWKGTSHLVPVLLFLGLVFLVPLIGLRLMFP